MNDCRFQRVRKIVTGAIEAKNEVGGDLFLIIKCTVYGIVKAGLNVKADKAETGVTTAQKTTKAAANYQNRSEHGYYSIVIIN